MRVKAIAPILFAVAAACGDNAHDATPDAASATPDAGFAEAPHGDPPQVVSGGGPVLAAPRVVPIFFTGDSAMQTQTEAYLAALAASSYWPTISKEYGVGAMTIDPTIVSTDTPPTTDTALAAWIAANVDGTHGWPVPDANTLYSVFLPSGVTITTSFGDSCSAFGGYHDETVTATNVPVVFAIMPRCPGGLDSLTVVTSHELLEASTDPYPYSNTAFANLDPDHGDQELMPGGELGDMCEYDVQAAQPLVGNYYVQRTWSNASIAAGHDPCVPVMPGAWAAGVPVLTDPLTIDPGDGSGLVPTKGISIPVGMSKTIEVDLFTDAPMPDWEVKADDQGLFTGDPTALTFTWDKTTGNNGDKLHLTITRVKAGMGGGTEMAISARPGGVSDSLWWGYVGN